MELRKHTRGIIVIDTSSLLALTTALEPPLGNFTCASGLLRFLAYSGYEIIIPEMVAYEVCKVLHDGKARRDISPAALRVASKSKLNPFFDGAIEFIWSLIKRPQPHLSIVPAAPDAASDAAAYIRAVRDIYSMKDKEAAWAEYEKLPKIEHLHYGDEAACDLVRHMPDNDIPVFYLCEDRNACGAMLAINRKPPIGVVNITGFLTAAKESKILDQMGLPEECTVADIRRAIINTLNERKREGYSFNKYSIERRHIDTSLAPIDQPSDLPFLHSVTDLMAEPGQYSQPRARSYWLMTAQSNPQPYNEL